jgi:lipoyl(octanoyl) transferase
MREMYSARIIDLGTRDYGEVWGMQRELVAARQRDEVPDTLLFVEHPHVITLGRGTHRENLVAVGDIPTFEIERGGDVTYHGPGQLVGYPIFLLRTDEHDLHAYLRNLEESLLRTVADFGVVGDRNPGWTGVWTGGATGTGASPMRKLASIGVAVKRWVTMHGFALNVSTDLSRFAAINPCGLQATVMSSIASELARPVEMETVKARVRVHFSDVFGRAFA